MHVEFILEGIKNLPLKEALELLVIKKIYGYSVSGFEKIKKVIVDKQNQGKYGFVPDKEEVLFLQEASKNPNYNQIMVLVPNYKHVDLIRTGFLLNSYNKKIGQGVEEDVFRKKIARIKSEISRRPGGLRLLKIVKLPTTEFFSVILSYLYELKIHGYSEEMLVEEFEELVEGWERSSMFVKGNQDVDDVIKFCKKRVGEGDSRFFILTIYEGMIEEVENAISQLELSNFFKIKRYEKKIFKTGTKDFPKIEASFYKKI